MSTAGLVCVVKQQWWKVCPALGIVLLGLQSPLGGKLRIILPIRRRIKKNKNKKLCVPKTGLWFQKGVTCSSQRINNRIACASNSVWVTTHNATASSSVGVHASVLYTVVVKSGRDLSACANTYEYVWSCTTVTCGVQTAVVNTKVVTHYVQKKKKCLVYSAAAAVVWVGDNMRFPGGRCYYFIPGIRYYIDCTDQWRPKAK